MAVRRLSTPSNRQVVVAADGLFQPILTPTLRLVEAVAAARVCIEKLAVQETHRQPLQYRAIAAQRQKRHTPPLGKVAVAAALAKPETPMGLGMAVTACPAPSAAHWCFMRVVVEARMTVRHCPVVTVAEGLVVERLLRQQRLSQGQMVLAVAVAVVVRPRLSR